MGYSVKKIFKYIGILFGSLTAIYVVLFIISWFLSGPPRPDAAFFETRDGENNVLVFAHQGGEAIRPTNTMIAFQHSVDLGTDVLDTDIHMTRDGELILLHDETVDRTSDGTGAVRDLTLDEIRQFDFGYNFSTDNNQTFPFRGQGQGIVTVEEFFVEFPDTRLGIEIKQTAPEAAVKLCDLITEFGYQDQVLVGSFTQNNMTIFRENCPTVATSGTESEVRKFYISQFVGLSGFYSAPFDALQVPERQNNVPILTGRFARTAKKQNLKIIPWTIDETEDFERLTTDFDIDGINTNYPDRLIEFLS